MQYDANNQKIYVFDAQGYVNTGKVYQYTESGVSGLSFTAGLIPTRIYEIK
jgi:DNA-binding beta-propeller fold protein YncE